MTTFTEEAEKIFYEGVTAWDKALYATKEVDKLDQMTGALQALCQGLAQLSQGLRATYIKLDHLESTVRQLKDPRKGFNG